MVSAKFKKLGDAYENEESIEEKLVTPDLNGDGVVARLFRMPGWALVIQIFIVSELNIFKV